MNLMFNINCKKVVKISGVTWGIFRGTYPSVHIGGVCKCEIYYLHYAILGYHSNNCQLLILLMNVSYVVRHE
jgi:hypothetical protein